MSARARRSAASAHQSTATSARISSRTTKFEWGDDRGNPLVHDRSALPMSKRCAGRPTSRPCVRTLPKTTLATAPVYIDESMSGRLGPTSSRVTPSSASTCARQRPRPYRRRGRLFETNASADSWLCPRTCASRPRWCLLLADAVMDGGHMDPAMRPPASRRSRRSSATRSPRRWSGRQHAVMPGCRT